MTMAWILSVSIALLAGVLCLADLPVAAASAVRELTAISLAFSVIAVIAYRGFLTRARRNPEGG